ncbi:hypothetical protein [Luteibacter sp.]|uniref:hypothetical protein n=1 Tax=Luteibacter sp. TaxID=1886636 RepID=UPI003F806529
MQQPFDENRFLATPFVASDLSHGSDRTYLQVTCGDVTACLAIERAGGVVYAEGLLWRDGAVVEEFSGALPVRGLPVEQAIRDAVALRLHQRAERKLRG